MMGLKTDKQNLSILIKGILIKAFLIIGKSKGNVSKAFILLHTLSVFHQLPGVHVKCLV